MAKFNMELLKKGQSENPKQDDIIDDNEVKSERAEDTVSKFKSTAEIFDKANAVIDLIEVEKLLPFNNHPFIVRSESALDELANSIKDNGIINPLIIRVHPQQKGYYEILAGHNRLAGAERVGLTTVPCAIKDVDDNVATLIVVESNKQRGFTDMLPSEIAKALMMEHQALKSQGKKTDLLSELSEIMAEISEENEPSNPVETSLEPTSFPVGMKLEKKFAATNTHRYIRLNYLIAPLLKLVDENVIAIRPAVELSFLTADEQNDVNLIINNHQYSVDMKKAAKLKEFSREKKLNSSTALQILSGEIFSKPIAKKLPSAIKLNYKKIDSYLDTSLPQNDIEEYIIKALSFYKEMNV